MSKIYQGQHNGTSTGDVTISLRHKGLIRELVLFSPSITSVTIRLNNTPATDFAMDIPANKRVVHLILLPVLPGNTITIFNPSNSTLQYEIYYA
jgi:hypothetical protein